MNLATAGLTGVEAESEERANLTPGDRERSPKLPCVAMGVAIACGERGCPFGARSARRTISPAKVWTRACPRINIAPHSVPVPSSCVGHALTERSDPATVTSANAPPPSRAAARTKGNARGFATLRRRTARMWSAVSDAATR
jgi:hypothetical protein